MSKTKEFYSVRTGLSRHPKGLPLEKVKNLFERIYKNFLANGYFHEYLGYYCVDSEDIEGKFLSPETDILLKIRKDDLWPIPNQLEFYSEDDLFDIIEYLFTAVSKPISGTFHSWNDCGMHWDTFDKAMGEQEFRAKINELLQIYEKKYELSLDGEILQKPDVGFEPIFEAEIPTPDVPVKKKIELATNMYRRHGASSEIKKQAIRELADILEHLRPHLKELYSNKDNSALFEIANNFSIRHFNKSQQSDYDPVWLNWIFYLYLATIHLALRKQHKP